MIAALLVVLLLVVCAIVRLYASLDEQWPRLDRKMAELVQPDPTHDRHRAFDEEKR